MQLFVIEYIKEKSIKHNILSDEILIKIFEDKLFVLTNYGDDILETHSISDEPYGADARFQVLDSKGKECFSVFRLEVAGKLLLKNGVDMDIICDKCNITVHYDQGAMLEINIPISSEQLLETYAAIGLTEK